MELLPGNGWESEEINGCHPNDQGGGGHEAKSRRQELWPTNGFVDKAQANPVPVSSIARLELLTFSAIRATNPLAHSPAWPLCDSTELLMGDIKQQMIRRKSQKAALYTLHMMYKKSLQWKLVYVLNCRIKYVQYTWLVFYKCLCMNVVRSGFLCSWTNMCNVFC